MGLLDSGFFAWFWRGTAFLWSLLVMALVGNAIAIQHHSNASVNYAMFAAVFTMVALLVWVASRFIGLPWVLLMAHDALAILFTLIAGIVLAARLHVHSCNNRGYLLTNGLTQGSEQRCRELQASTAFLWFLFASLCVCALTLFSDRSRSSSTTSFRGPRSTGTAPMSQV